jgi:hypothetical protein
MAYKKKKKKKKEKSLSKNSNVSSVMHNTYATFKRSRGSERVFQMRRQTKYGRQVSKQAAMKVTQRATRTVVAKNHKKSKGAIFLEITFRIRRLL